MKPDVQVTISQFDQLTTALIDTSSIIYMEKVGFLDLIAERIQLVTIPEVLIESGESGTHFTIIQSPADGGSTDQKLILASRLYRHPVISEDKAILTQVQGLHIPFFNSLMMLVYLYHQQVITPEAYLNFYKHLQGIARYGERIWKFGNTVFKTLDQSNLR